MHHHHYNHNYRGGGGGGGGGEIFRYPTSPLSEPLIIQPHHAHYNNNSNYNNTNYGTKIL